MMISGADGLPVHAQLFLPADLEPGERSILSKRRLIQQASTRTYRAGTHPIELQVAGRVVASSSFDVRL